VAKGRSDRLKKRTPYYRRDMQKLLTMLGMTIGGYVGWLIGAPVGIFTAFILSMVGTAAGVYAARRFAERFLP
jgi:hypothetical protein